MYINTSKTLDVVIDLCLDNLNDDEIKNAKQLGDLFRDARKELSVYGKFSKDMIEKLGCCIYVENDDGSFVDSWNLTNLHLLEQK